MLSTPRQAKAARRLHAQARRGGPWSRKRIVVKDADADLDEIERVLIGQLNRCVSTRVRWSDEGFTLFTPIFERVLNDVSGRRAPKRKRPRRVQKKIDKRFGAMHYALAQLAGTSNDGTS